MSDMKQIEFEGDIWNVVNFGAIDQEAGLIWAHLSSTTRFHQQRNGKNPVQALVQLPLKTDARPEWTHEHEWADEE
jgi:hypothetical protein